ncbi:unnamed protein product [Colias eurytheme]|nr:unnamed protein product [Colias eurytheme]
MRKLVKSTIRSDARMQYGEAGWSAGAGWGLDRCPSLIVSAQHPRNPHPLLNTTTKSYTPNWNRSKISIIKSVCRSGTGLWKLGCRCATAGRERERGARLNGRRRDGAAALSDSASPHTGGSAAPRSAALR